MTDTLFRRIVLPVASVEDAETTAEQALPRLRDERDDGGEVLAVHVVEKAGGAPDKASVEQREERARDVFDAVEDALAAAGVPVETEIRYGTDVADTILAAADEFDASAVVFTPRGGSRWVKLLTGDTAAGLVERSNRPVVVLPDDGGEDNDADENGVDGNSVDGNAIDGNAIDGNDDTGNGESGEEGGG